MSLHVCNPHVAVRFLPEVPLAPDDHDPNWRRVEQVVSRFAAPNQRKSVRVFLYSVLGDIDGFRRHIDPFMGNDTIARSICRGREFLEDARRLDPDLFGRLMAAFVMDSGYPEGDLDTESEE